MEEQKSIMKNDVYIYGNGWVSPRTRKALAKCSCGVKFDNPSEAKLWCKEVDLTYICFDHT